MEKRLVGRTSNGIEIYAINSDEHMAAHATVTDKMLEKALSLVEYNAPFWMETVDVGEIIGNDNCVLVSEADDVRMLYRKGREGRTPIVFGKKAPETTMLTIGIKNDTEDGRATIFTAFTGAKAPREPWDSSLEAEDEKSEAEYFWATHALVYDETAIDSERN